MILRPQTTLLRERGLSFLGLTRCMWHQKFTGHVSLSKSFNQNMVREPSIIDSESGGCSLAKEFFPTMYPMEVVSLWGFIFDMKHLWGGGVYFVPLFASSCLAPPFPYAIPNLPLVDPMGSSYLCLSLFLNFPLLLCKAHWVGRKCFQVLVLLQSNSSFILSICEILWEELPSVPTAILLPCDLRGEKMAGQSSRACPGVVLCEDAAGGPWSSLATAAPVQLSGLRCDPSLRCSRTAFRYLSCCHS